MSLPQWKGLFDWSMKYQDGTVPTEWDPAEYNPEKLKWLEGVLKHYMQDFAERMRQIKTALDTGVAPPPAVGEEAAASDNDVRANDQQQQQGQLMSLQDKEQLLEELQDIVSSIDFARDLHKIGGLPTLLDLLRPGQPPSLQWRAAEVVATCVANNPPVQQWFLEGGVLPHLLGLLHSRGSEEADVMLRVKALLALSGLVRNHPPSLAALLGEQGGGALGRMAELVGDADARVQRKALSLLTYLATEQPHVTTQLGQTGVVAASSNTLQQPPQPSTSDALVAGSDVRQAALELLGTMARAADGWHALKQCASLGPNLEALSTALTALPPEDQACCEDETAALAALAKRLAGPPPPNAPLAAQGQSAQGGPGPAAIALLGPP